MHRTKDSVDIRQKMFKVQKVIGFRNSLSTGAKCGKNMGYEAVVDKVEAYARRVAKRYHFRLIVVYGSYARGTATKDGDIDIYEATE